MATLLLRLAAPLQAWGTDSKFETRRTGREPSKSGVIGLLAAALGRRRDEPVEDLAALRFGVRVEQEGTLLHDFHIAQAEKASYLTHRYYLEDAVFLVGLESEDKAFLEELERAINSPAFPLFLGRRSCPPDYPITQGIRETNLVETLRSEEWAVSDYRKDQWNRRNGDQRPKLCMMVDALPTEASLAVQRDVPVSFDPRCRRFVDRNVEVCRPVEADWKGRKGNCAETTHDVWGEMGAEP